MSEIIKQKKALAWNLLIFFLVTFSAVETPVAYVLELKMEAWNYVLDALICSIFALDIYFSLKGKVNLEDELNLEMIKSKPYKDSVFLPLDIIASIPFDLITLFLGLDSLTHFARFFRLIRLVRVVKLVNLMRNLGDIPRFIKISMVVTWFGVLINWIACGWMIVYPQPENMDVVTFYNKAIYWAVTTLTTIGYGDITPTTNLGRSYTMVIMVLGVGVYSLIIGSVSKMFYMMDKREEMMKEKLSDLAMYMKHYHIPKPLQKQVYHFYNHLMQKRMSENDQKILQELPNALQSELLIYTKIKLISNVKIFRNVTMACMKDIARSLEQVFYMPGETIINQGEVGQEMFIIGHGEVEVIGPEGQVLATLGPGACFGEIALIQEVTRQATVRSKSYCDLYKLTKENFLPTHQRFIKLQQNMQDLIKSYEPAGQEEEASKAS